VEVVIAVAIVPIGSSIVLSEVCVVWGEGLDVWPCSGTFYPRKILLYAMHQ
jgi:hypothetical protein